MKILAIAYTLKANSGWGRYARSVLDELSHQGVPYIAAAYIRGDVDEPTVQLAGVTRLGFLRNCIRARRAARDCDIVHAFDFWPFAVYGWYAVIGTHKKLFITGVGTYSVAPFNTVFKYVLLSRAARRAQKIFSIGDYTKRRILEKIALKNIETVFWGTSPLTLPKPEEMVRYRARYLVPDRHPIILTVGDVKHRKGQFDTLKAIQKIVSTYPDALYITIGHEEDMPEYPRAMRAFAAAHNMERNLLMIGGLHDDRALAYFYSIADLFVMNSNNEGDTFEGFGLVFLEAEQFGVPVVGSRNCGIEQALEDGYNGALTNQGDVDDIAEKLSKVLSANREAFGAHSKEFAARFSWEKTVSAYIEAYNK